MIQRGGRVTRLAAKQQYGRENGQQRVDLRLPVHLRQPAKKCTFCFIFGQRFTTGSGALCAFGLLLTKGSPLKKERNKKSNSKSEGESLGSKAESHVTFGKFLVWKRFQNL